MLLTGETWRPGPEVEREQLARIAQNARLDAYASVAWPLVLSAVLVSNVQYIGGAPLVPLMAWLATMACWAVAAWSLTRRSFSDRRDDVPRERRDYCILYFCNSLLWSFGILIIIGIAEPRAAATAADHAGALVQTLFAMLVALGLGTTLAVQNSAHVRVFACAMGPVGIVPGAALLAWADGVHAALGVLLLLLAGWIFVIGLRIHAEFTMRLQLERNLSASRDEARRLMHRAEEASRAKSGFMASMSHELRTPLNAIIGFSETLGMRLFRPDDPRAVEYAWDIHASGKHLLSLIEDILHVQKIESGAKLYSMQPGDLTAEIEETRALLQERAGRKAIDLTFDLSRSAQAVFDPRAIRQALINLTANAIEHTPEGGRVAVRLSRRPRTWLLEVIDNGPGIPDELAPHIFEAFVTSSNTPYAVDKQGTGLGLHITHEIVRAHRGRIVFDTSAQGTRFRVLLPAPREERERDAA